MAIRRERARRIQSPLRRWHAAAALALAVAFSAALAIIILAGPRLPRAVKPAREATEVATAFGYPYPVRCVTIRTSGSLMRVRVWPASAPHPVLSGQGRYGPRPVPEQCPGVPTGAQQ